MQAHDSIAAKKINIEKVFEKFPNEFFWHLIMDQDKWASNNPMAFDEDESKGYFNSVSTALYLSLLTIDLPVSIDLIIGLHDIAYHDKESSLGLSLKEEGISGIGAGSFTKDGLIELINKIRENKVKLSFIYSDYKNENEQLKNAVTFELNPKKTSAQLAKEILELVQSKKTTFVGLKRKTSIKDALETSRKYLNRYHQEIKAAKSKKQKITAIVKLIQDMHQYHPFTDGNGRTFIFLLLNILLIQNQLSPSTVKKPSRFTGWSVKELVKEVLEGQKDFAKQCKSKKIQKYMPFLDYIKKKINLTEDAKMQGLAQINFKMLYMTPNGKEYLEKCKSTLYKKILEKIYDQETIDFMFAKMPPSEELTMVLETCGFFGNDYMARKMIDISSSSEYQLKKFKDPETIYYLLDNFTAEQLKIFFEHSKSKSLVFNSEDIINILVEPTDTSIDTQISIFTHLLLNNKSTSLEVLLNKLDSQLYQMLSTEMQGANGLQILAALDFDLYKKVSKKIKSTEVHELLHKEIKIDDPTLQRIKNFNFQDQKLIEHLNIASPGKILQQHGLYQVFSQENPSKSGKQEVEVSEDIESVDIKKPLH